MTSSAIRADGAGSLEEVDPPMESPDWKSPLESP